MSRYLLPLLLVATSAFAGGDARKTPLGREVEALIAQHDLLPAEGISEPYLSAAAQAGVMGWASLRVDVWFPALSGDINDANGNSASVSDLGIDQTETSLVPRALLSFGGAGMLIDVYRFQTEGDGTITQTFTFGGVNFTVNEDVHTDLDMTNVRGLLTIPVVDTDVVRISLMGGISYYDIQATVTGQSSGSGSITAPIPVPLVGILGQAKFGPVLLELEVSGLTFDYGDYNINYLDLQASVGVTFLKIVAVRAGYRLVSISGSIEDFDLDAVLDGFFVGGSVNF